MTAATGSHAPLRHRPTLLRWMRATRCRGSHVVEFVIIVPAVLLIIGVIIVAGHVGLAHQKVEHAAAEAARAASIARPAATAAGPAARTAAEADMIAQGLRCTSKRIDTDVASLSLDPGIPAFVRVTITCEIELSVLGIPRISGHRTITHTAVSPADTYRERAR
ncbi:TadE family protein [Nocardia sp. IFM 10818]